MNVWQYIPLSDAVKKQSSNLSMQKLNGDEGEYPVFGAKGEVGRISTYHQDSPYIGIIKDGAGIGRVFRLPEKSSVLATLQYLVPQKGQDIDFLKYFLESIDFEIFKTGSTIPHIYFKDYKELPYPNLPIEEQKRIVAILDEAFAGIDQAIANTEQNIQNARELFESYLNTIFTQKSEGWIRKKLGEILDITSSKRIMEKDWAPSGVPFYGGKEIVSLSKTGTARSNAYISEDKYKEYALKYDMPKQGDVLITARGTIGVGYIVKEGDKFYYKDGNIISMRAKTPLNPNFILLAFESNVFLSQLDKLTGTTVVHLPINKAKELYLNVPDLINQNSLVEIIESFRNKVDEFRKNNERKLCKLKELKQSLLQKAFTGELTADLSEAA